MRIPARGFISLFCNCPSSSFHFDLSLSLRKMAGRTDIAEQLKELISSLKEQVSSPPLISLFIILLLCLYLSYFPLFKSLFFLSVFFGGFMFGEKIRLKFQIILVSQSIEIISSSLSLLLVTLIIGLFYTAGLLS